MTEENKNAESVNAGVAVVNADVTGGEKPAGYVPRSAIVEQVTPLRKQIEEQQAELERFRSAEAERKAAELKAAQNFEELEKTYKQQIEEMQNNMKSLSVQQKRTSLESKLVAAGLNPEDAQHKLIMAGVMASYDGESDVAEWFETFRTANAAVFEKPAITRNVSATGTPAPSHAQTDTGKLIAAFKRGNEWAISEVTKMNSEGRLTNDLAAQLGLRINN